VGTCGHVVEEPAIVSKVLGQQDVKIELSYSHAEFRLSNGALGGGGRVTQYAILRGVDTSTMVSAQQLTLPYVVEVVAPDKKTKQRLPVLQAYKSHLSDEK
jgi:hypothetical protein